MLSWLKRQGLPLAAAMIAGALLLIFIAAFCLTHGGWYDYMDAKEKATFWADFGVSFGTIALALVTWASVYETQQVLQGEDKRFQQSRKPMVRMHEAFPQRPNPGSAYQQNIPFAFEQFDGNNYWLSIINKGDGPALRVSVMFTLVATYVPAVGNNAPQTRDFNYAKVLTSYLAANESLQFHIDNVIFDATLKKVGHDIGTLSICYEDAFGSAYETHYEHFLADRLNFAVRDVAPNETSEPSTARGS